MNANYETTAAYVSGAICGQMWMPNALAGNLIQENARGPWGFYQEASNWTFRDALLSLLMHKGGDFQNGEFTADTVFRIERRRQTGKGYEFHVWEREIGKLPDCEDLVNADAYVCDFIGEDY